MEPRSDQASQFEKRNFMQCRRAILLFLCVMPFFLPPPLADAENEPQCLELLLGKCRECHYMTRICQSLDKKNKWTWRRTIRNMANKGAEVTRAQEDRILDCLVDKAKDVVNFCENPPPLSSMPPLKYPDGVKK